ncbi:MerR family transcriptional regulator [Tissierella sp. P1]|uniref:MerR family transcriptional regulator n=1 Tax=unclassified Tissierella TaxID=2638726 RepID=UPI000BA177CA|nr:MerR family transcriptional regulator [Tissierella sp. P1]MDU5080921.1 MerR family transcriptional regulator [Bacillota bacterium]OZV11817.1 MerR family transcriptional regulator [Tissierella sp. P1]
MEYTVQRLANLAGISSRTLRYYDEIGILKPARINSSGYRIYSNKEVDRLQQILFYRELDMDLESIKKIVTSVSFDESSALIQHREKLLQKRNQIDLLIANVEKTIALKEGRIKMSDKEKFEGFKQKMISDNEERFGKEAREKYGDEQVDKSNKMLRNMTEEQYKELQKLGSNVIETLKLAYDTKNPGGELAQKAVDLHRQWLSYFWDSYTKEAHANLAQMYVEDERFKEYYDKEQPGLAEFLRDAVSIYANMI